MLLFQFLKASAIIKNKKKDSFSVTLKFLNLPVVTGKSGLSKADAQEKAALVALKLLNSMTDLDVHAKAFLQEPKLSQKNARVILKELADILKLPNPNYEFAEPDLSFTTTAKINMDSGSLSSPAATASTLREAEELAAGLLLKTWFQYIADNKETIKDPIKYVEALTKYLSIKSFAYEKYSAERKLTDPAVYYTKVLTKGNEVFVVGDKQSTVTKADEDAARKVIFKLLSTNCSL